MNWRHTLHLAALALSLAASALVAGTAQAAVRTPYQLDTTFNGSGYWVGPSDSEGGDYDTTGFGATRLAFDGDDTILVHKTNAWGDRTMSQIGIQRIGKNGTPVGGEGRFGIPAFEGAEWRVVAVRDVLVASAQRRLFILIDAKKASSDPNELVRSFLAEFRIDQPTYNVTRIGEGTGPSSHANQVGVRLAQSGGRLFVLHDTRLLPGQNSMSVDDSYEVHLTAFAIKSSTSTDWSGVDTSWGTNGRRAYHHEVVLLGDPGFPDIITWSRVRASQLEIAPTGAIFVAGDIEMGSNNLQLFILKISDNNNGQPSTFWPTPARPENQGWLTLAGNNAVHAAAGLVLRPLPSNFAYDIFLLSAFKRPCGNGLIVYALSQTGVAPSPSRTWTHGGGATAGTAGQECDSILANDMTLIPGASNGDGDRLAIVGRYVIQGGATLMTAGSLLTLNPVNLQPNPGEQVQEILPDDVYQGDTNTFRFQAARYHTGQKRLLAVGTYNENNGPYSEDRTLIARMKEAPLFADGFEGN